MQSKACEGLENIARAKELAGLFGQAKVSSSPPQKTMHSTASSLQVGTSLSPFLSNVHHPLTSCFWHKALSSKVIHFYLRS